MNKITGSNRYCGPSAISFICGIDTDAASRIIRHKYKKTFVRATYPFQMEGALELLGCGVSIFSAKATKARPTIKKWLENVEHALNENNYYLIQAGHHWQVYHRGLLCHSLQKTPVSINDFDKPRRIVKRVWEVSLNKKTPTAITRKVLGDPKFFHRTA